MLLAAEIGFWSVSGCGSAHAADVANSSETPAATVVPAASAIQPVAPSAKQLRDAVAESVRRASAAKGNDRAAAIKALLDVYRRLLAATWLLPSKERLRLGICRCARSAATLRQPAPLRNDP